MTWDEYRNRRLAAFLAYERANDAEYAKFLEVEVLYPGEAGRPARIAAALACSAVRRALAETFHAQLEAIREEYQSQL